ncbi:plasmid replication DNA-binding protein KfrA [Marinobacter pelagius]|uniref:Plasmid replication DNA-binding protein KfrA n=1 Tax=Marinobacter pelagius TaxID=379482 RepID=A0A366FXN0_9GAMM|nr:DNA-binding protein [Marinobacter pelagius]RBP19452.1 plasmid replication DNA-binding protein KfrA [Marinobacter pelagius]
MATTEDRIIEAAEKLEAEGVNPTQVNVRDALGGGSFATIGPVLKKWKESKKEDSQLAEVRVPEAITERLDQLQGAVWHAAVEEADRRLAAEREALHQAQEAAAAEVREHLDSIAALEAEATEYQRKIVALEDTCNDLDASRHNAQAELAEQKEKFQRDKTEITELLLRESGLKDAAEARAERAEALHQEAIKQGRADLAEARKEHKAEIDAVKKEATAQVEAAEKRAQEQAKRAEKAEKDAQQRAAGEQACQGQLEAAQRELEQMRKRMAKLEEKADTATQEAAELRGEVKALREANPVKGKG